MRLSEQRMKVLRLLYQDRAESQLPTLSVEKVAERLGVSRSDAWAELNYLEESGYVSIRTRQIGARIIYILAITVRGIDVIEAAQSQVDDLRPMGDGDPIEPGEQGVLSAPSARIHAQSLATRDRFAPSRSASHAIFVSHSHHDNDFCRRLVASVRRHFPSADIFYDESELEGGDDFVRRIPRELMNRPIFIVVISDRSVASPWVREETNVALRKAVTDLNRRVIPILYREGDMDLINPLLRNRQIIDCAYRDESLGFGELVLLLRSLVRPGVEPG